ncbi:MAG: hypothetical protein RBT69_02820, partial [Spirochaetia bacterium]|nr:hypothetical protein [Spirochaetia bacterium]
TNFIKKKEVHNLSLAVSGDDPDNRWFLSNLLENRIFTSIDSYLTAGLLPERNVILISTMCGARYIEVFMDSSGWGAWFSGATEIQSGNW